MSKQVEGERHHFFANKGCLYSSRTAQNCLTMKQRAAKNESDVIGFDVVGRQVHDMLTKENSARGKQNQESQRARRKKKRERVDFMQCETRSSPSKNVFYKVCTQLTTHHRHVTQSSGHESSLYGKRRKSSTFISKDNTQ